MHNHKATLIALALLCCFAAACTFPSATATPTVLILPTQKPPTAPPPTEPAPSATSSTFPTLPPQTVPVSTQIIVTQGPGTLGETPVPSATFCADSQPTNLINSLKTALQSSNGPTLASLVSPIHGMEARLYRNGRVVTYDQRHAKFLFETTYVVNWGPAPGSGQVTRGSFHQLIIPDLLDVFNKGYTLTCNQIQVGGTTYQALWPYSNINFYSLYYPGTQANGNMDWHTWLLGMHYVNGKPYLYAIMQFKWEP